MGLRPYAEVANLSLPLPLALRRGFWPYSLVRLNAGVLHAATSFALILAAAHSTQTAWRRGTAAGPCGGAVRSYFLLLRGPFFTAGLAHHTFIPSKQAALHQLVAGRLAGGVGGHHRGWVVLVLTGSYVRAGADVFASLIQGTVFVALAAWDARQI